MGIQTFFSRTLVTFYLLICLLTINIIAAVDQQQATAALQQETFDRLYAKVEPLVEDYSKQDLTALLDKADHFSSDSFLYPILHAPEIKHQAMQAFRDKLLYHVDTHGVLPTIPSIGIYTKDIIRLLLYSGILFNEKLLLRIYTEYIVNHCVDHLLQSQLTSTLAAKQERDRGQENATNLSHFAPPVFTSFHTNLKGIATSRCLTSHIWHAALSLFIDACKNHYLLHEESHSKFFLAAPTQKSLSEPKPLFSLLQETLLVEIPLNIPDATAIHMIIHTLSSYNILPPVSHHFLLQASKHIVSSLLFLYFFTTKTILSRWEKLLQENQQEIITLVQEYQNSQTDTDIKTTIKNRLKQLTSAYISPTYTLWLKEKHRYITRIDACYYALFLIPAIYKGVIWAHNFYKTATQEPSQGAAS